METTLLDYSYGSSRIAPLRASDIDFGDVFGGPPRGSSIHGSMRYSFTEGADSVAAARRLGKTTSFRDPWASTEQKAVFGGGVEGGSRRWSLQEDFFVDIFGGSESMRSRTPRKHDRDAFSASSRGWRSLSSAWPLPPRAEGFLDPSSEPTQFRTFSLPDKLSSPVDSPAFGSPARASNNDAASNGTTRLHSPKMSVFRFSSRAVRVRDESGNNGPQRLPGTLSQRFPRGTDDSLGLTKHEKMDDLEKHTGNPRGDAHSSRFRFSMYKWASKGVATTDNGPKVSESPYATPFNIDDRKVTVEGSPWSSENGPGRKRRMGKVKDFIRIFNREAHPGKPRTGIPSEDQSFTKKDNGTSEATKEAYVGRNAAVNDRASVFQLEKPRVHPEKVADPYEHSPTENSTTDSNDILFSDTSPGHDTSPGQKDSSASSTASITDDARATDEDADESSGTYFTVRELAQDESEQVQPTEDCEEIRTTDAKIRQWSRGKEGNIRSLLSTLQYVLWPESGWKPVPLVNVIEGTAVKRSYQKALLCLHPDKLQQKGAASDQKYIAEQVFEILQEAWTHFNGLGLVAP